MKKLAGHIFGYWKEVDKRVLLPSMLFIAAAIAINYHYGLSIRIDALDSSEQFFSWYGVFLLAFGLPYVLAVIVNDQAFFKQARFLALLLMAPAVFAWKMSYDFSFFFSSDSVANAYWNRIAYWPFRLAVVTAMLGVLWLLFERRGSFYGMTLRQFSARPYFLMLLVMLPLIAAASTQPDFLAVYPKLMHVRFFAEHRGNWLYALLYELSYGSDFVGIELFFRGFLVLAFVRWAGKDAILPMALFYCTIHFGKPLGECISSFFGGIILGVVTYHTRTIFGGLLVHLGIAWLMELGGYLGHHW